MSRSRRFAWYIVTQWTASMANAAVALALIPFLQDELGDDGYGLTVLVMTIASFSLVAQFGLRAALGRHMSEQIALKDRDEINRLFSSAVVTFVAISLAVTLVLCLLAEPIARLCKVPPSLFDDAVLMIRIFSTGTVTLSLLTPAWGSVLVGHSRFDLIDYAMITEIVLRAVGILGVLTWTSWGLLGWCGAVLGAKFVGFLLTAIFAHWYHVGLKGRPSLVNRASLTNLFSLGGLISLRQLALRVNQAVEPVLVSAFLGPVAVSYYGPASRLLNAPWLFITAIGRQFTPMATGSHTIGDDAKVREILFRGTRLTFSVGTIATVLSVAFAHPLVYVWLGAGRGTTAWILIAGAVGQWMQYAMGSQWEVMLGKNNVRYFSLVQIAAAIANVGLALLSVSLAYRYDWPTDADRLLGCSLAVVLPGSLVRTVERALISHHVAAQCSCRTWDYFRNAYFGPYVALAVSLGVALLIRGVADLDTWPRLIAASAVVSLVWAAVTWGVVFDRVDRDRALSVFRRQRSASLTK